MLKGNWGKSNENLNEVTHETMVAGLENETKTGESIDDNGLRNIMVYGTEAEPEGVDIDRIKDGIFNAAPSTQKLAQQYFLNWTKATDDIEKSQAAIGFRKVIEESII